MTNTLRAGILTIGTEVSSGQIVNSNAAWIANELGNLRIRTDWHLTVADEKTDMLDAMRLMQSRVDVLVITGGLGPTSDDFTRNIVAEWAGETLNFDPASWDHICQRFDTLGIANPPESNRQQCYFPKSARILSNRNGTAHGFSLKVQGVDVYCLPGPPVEIKTIWQEHIAAELQSRTAASDPVELLKWQCMGVSESKLGELIDPLIRGSTLVAGYRPHMPYIEIKIWCSASRRLQENPIIEALDAALSRWTVARGEEDCLEPLLAHFMEFRKIDILDAQTGGLLAARIGGRSLPSALTIVSCQNLTFPDEAVLDEGTLQLRLGPLNEAGEWEIWYRTASLQQLRQLTLHFKSRQSGSDRERQFVCEQSIVGWAAMIQKGFRIA